MRVEVTAEDVEAGKPHDGELCPVALALRRATGLPWHVHGFYARVVDDGPAVLPREAALAVLRFDRGDGMEPFSFEFSRPG